MFKDLLRSMDQWLAKKTEMTNGLLVFNVLGALALGHFLGWAFYSEPLLFAVNIAWGTAGEWVAAAGTFGVGYMAWRIARESHKHRLFEYQQAEAQNTLRRNARVTAARLRTSRAKRIELTIRNVLTKDGKHHNRSSFTYLLKLLPSLLVRVSWSEEERAYMSFAALKALDSIDGGVFRMTEFVREMKTKDFGEEAPDGLNEDEIRWLEKLYEFSVQTKNAAETLHKLMSKK